MLLDFPLLMKVIMGAYACEPGTGSEPGVGWNWAVQAARRGYEVHVITRKNNREVVEAKQETDPIPNLTFHYFDLPRPFLWAKKRSGYYGLLVYYYLWQFGEALLARKLHARFQFDLAHHVTFVNDWMPSGLSLLPIPFVWGPVGGTTHVIPKPLWGSLSRDAKRFERMRRASQRLLRLLDPFVAFTRSRADVVLTYTDEALDGLPKRTRRKARSIVHIGVDESDVPPAQAPPTGGPLMIVTGGRLVHWKGFDMLIEGLEHSLRARPGEVTLRITGTGPFKTHLEELVRSHGLEDSVEFLGMLSSREDVFELIARSHIYALPTLRDGPPVALLEAMVVGRPVLCLDIGATRESVPDEAGLKIPVRDREQIVSDIGAALEWGIDHRDELASMGRAARAIALDRFAWANVGHELDAIYVSLGVRARDSLPHS